MYIRLAEPADALAVAQVHVSSWQSAYRGLLPHAYLDALRPEDRAPHYNFLHTDPLQPRTLVAAEDSTIYGFVTTMPSREPDMQSAVELAALYVDPAHWSKGIGRQLLNTACDSLRSSSHDQAYLWILSGNARAERFYTLHGWQTDGVQKSDVLWGVAVEEFRYRRNLKSA